MSYLDRALEKARAEEGEPATAGNTGESLSQFTPSWGFNISADSPQEPEVAAPAASTHRTSSKMQRTSKVQSAPMLPRISPGPTRLVREFSPEVREKLVVGAAAAPELREQFRRIAAALYRLREVRPLKVLMVVSAVPAEGKTLTSVNLALTLSESYNSRVLLLDADLRRPTIHQVLDIPNVAGLREELKSGNGLTALPSRISANLEVLTAGKVSMDPMSALTSERMRGIVEEAADAFDWVLIDTPPVELLPDAGLLMSLADGAILVIRAGSTRCQFAQRAIEAIGRERILGVVLNQVTDEMGASAYNGYGYYGTE